MPFRRTLIGSVATISILFLPVAAKAADLHQRCNTGNLGVDAPKALAGCGTCTFGPFPGYRITIFCIPCG
jgi:hypothetical protein